MSLLLLHLASHIHTHTHARAHGIKKYKKQTYWNTAVHFQLIFSGGLELLSNLVKHRLHPLQPLVHTLHERVHLFGHVVQCFGTGGLHEGRRGGE